MLLAKLFDYQLFTFQLLFVPLYATLKKRPPHGGS